MAKKLHLVSSDHTQAILDVFFFYRFTIFQETFELLFRIAVVLSSTLKCLCIYICIICTKKQNLSEAKARFLDNVIK